MPVSEFVATLPLDGISIVGFAMIVALMVYRGLLVPRRTHDEVRQDRDHWRKAAADWQAAFTSAQEIKHELVRQNTELIRNAEVAARSLDAIRAEAEKPRRGA